MDHMPVGAGASSEPTAPVVSGPPRPRFFFPFGRETDYSAFRKCSHTSFFRRLIILIKKIQKIQKNRKSVLLARSLALRFYNSLSNHLQAVYNGF